MEQSTFEQNTGISSKLPLPNSAATLVLGILSIVFCWCCWFGGIVSLTVGIIALVISNKPLKMYKEKPDLYTGYNNLNAGRIMAIIGLCIASLWIFAVMIIGFAALSFSEILKNFR